MIRLPPPPVSNPPLNRCTEVVYRDMDADQLAHMLEVRYTSGWQVDRIIDHMVDSSNKMHDPPKVIYLFKRMPMLSPPLYQSY